jgi:hypothetical protein
MPLLAKRALAKDGLTGATLARALRNDPRGKREPGLETPDLGTGNTPTRDPRKGAPTFVTEPPGDSVLESPNSLDDTHRYVENIAAWLSARV